MMAKELAHYSWRHMRRRRGRTALTLAGIVIGVAAVVAVPMAVENSRGAHREMFAAMGGQAALEVVCDGEAAFDPAAADAIRLDRDVAACVPVVRRAAVIVGRTQGWPVMVMGIDPRVDEAARTYRLVAGSGLADGGSNAALLETEFARTIGSRAGSAVRLLSLAGTSELRVAGELAPEGAAAFNGGAVVIVALETAQRLFAMEGRVTGLQIVLRDAANADAVAARIRDMLPTGLSLQRTTGREALVDETLHATEKGLSVLSVVSLVAGAVVILNSFLMSLGERRRELAILRALGATRSQVTRLLLREAALLGVLGAVGGIGVGIAMSVGLTQTIGQVLGVSLRAGTIVVWPIIVGLLVGPGAALVATIIPARNAAARGPLVELTATGRATRVRVTRWPVLTGVGVLVIGAVFVVGLIRDWWPARESEILLPIFMGAYCFALVVMMQPALPALIAGATAILTRAIGLEGRLAGRQLRRRPTRTALTVGVLAVAIMVSIGVGHNILTSVRDVRGWADTVGDADFFVRGSLPDPGTMSMAAPLPESLGGEISRIAGVRRVERLNFLPARAGKHTIVVLAADAATAGPMRVELQAGDPSTIAEAMRRGEVLAGTALARRLGVGVGDQFILETAVGPQPVRVAGLITEYTAGGLNIGMEWETARRLYGMDGVHVFMVDVAPGALAEATRQIEAFCRERGLTVHSRAGFAAMVQGYMDGVVASLWVIMSLVYVVALLGVVNTLTMSVLEQTREIGVMRAVAMSRRQLRRMIAAEAAGLGLVSLVPGAVGGMALAYMMHVSVYPVTGVIVSFVFEKWLFAGTLIAALLIAVGGSWAPARRAAGLRVIEALRYE